MWLTLLKLGGFDDVEVEWDDVEVEWGTMLKLGGVTMFEVE